MPVFAWINGMMRSSSGGLEDGETLRASVIISNGDIKSSVKRLVGSRYFPDDYVRRIQSLTYSYQAVTLKVALKEKITDGQLLESFEFCHFEER